MRLDSRNGDIHWQVYHAERCEVLRCVQWVDDHTNQWAEVLIPIRLNAARDDIVKEIHQARKIEILAGQCLVVIDPIEGGDMATERTIAKLLEPA